MKYRIKWVNKFGEEGYGFLIYNTKEEAQATVDDLNKDDDFSWEIADESDE